MIKKFLIFVICLLMLTPSTVFAEGDDSINLINIDKNSNQTESQIIPTITTYIDNNTGEEIKKATVMPYDVSSSYQTNLNRGYTTKIKLEDIENYAKDNGINEVEIISGLNSTQSPTGKHAPQIILVDNNGNTVLKVEALGGQLRFDKKMKNDNSIVGHYDDTKDESTAIEYADLRLKYTFKLPEGVDITSDTTSWSWNLTSTFNNKNINLNINGIKYLPVKNQDNTFTSNVVLTNINISNYQSVNYKVGFALSYVKDGITYRIVQPITAPLSRNLNSMVKYYKSITLDNETQAYIDAIKGYIEEGSYTPIV